MKLQIIFKSELKMDYSSKHKMKKYKTSTKKQRRKSLRHYVRGEKMLRYDSQYMINK